MNFNGKEIFELARPITDNDCLFEGDTPTEIEVVEGNYGEGDSVCLVSKVRMTLSSHAATHADQPPHFVKDPKYKEFPLESYYGEAYIIDLSNGEGPIEMDELLRAFEAQFDAGREQMAGKRLLLKTMKSGEAGEQRYLGDSLKAFLEQVDIPLIGIDTKSVDRHNESQLEDALHGALYRTRTAIVENLVLDTGPSQGEIYTVFDPARRFTDSHGITQILYVTS